MTARTGGDIVVEALKALDVKHIFGIPSVHNLPIFDAIARDGSIEAIIVRNEQAAAHSADGYSRASGKLGVIVASTGPGTTNTVTGLYEAQFASSRVLLITGQVDAVYYGKGRGPGHQADRQLHMLQTVTRRVESPRHTQDIGAAIFRTAEDILSGRPQPGAVEIPIDLQYAESDRPLPSAPQVLAHSPSESSLDQAAIMLGTAKKRVIYAGGGLQSPEASAQLVKLAEALQAPVFTSGNGRGAIPDDHPLSMGAMMNSNQFRDQLAEADVLLAVGTWFHGGDRTWKMQIPKQLIHIDVDPLVHGLVFQADVDVVGDAALSLAGITDRLNAEPGEDNFLSQIDDTHNKVVADMRGRIGPDYCNIMDTMREQMPRDAILVRDMTIPAYMWGNQLFPILQSRTTMNPTSGAIGPGLPLANGAAAATGKKTVIIQGDGGFMVHIGELATTVQYQLPLVICVFTDGGYGVLRGFQTNQMEGRTIGVNLATPNFAALAEAIGLKGISVNGVDEFNSAFAEAMAAAGPVLLDINQASLIPMQGMGAPHDFTQPLTKSS